MTPYPILKKYLTELVLVGIILLSGFLYFYNLSQNGYANSYYAAAVRSMIANPSVMIWGSFDSAGFVTVDKPPVAVWVQTVSALIFGYTGWALILPQALAGVGSVILLYLVISRSFGKPAGLVAAFVLGITPIAVAVGRTNNLDGLLVFVLLIAFMTALEAWKRGSLVFLIATAVLVGIGFNIKMIEAFAVVPGFFGIYLFSRPIPLKMRFAHLICAGIILVVVSFSWAVMVDMTPADQRPYLGSSDTNSALELIFGYNGLSRIIGTSGHSGDGSSGFNRSTVPPGFQNIPDDASNQGFPPFMSSNTTPDQGSLSHNTKAANLGQFKAGIPSQGMGGTNEAGTPGLLRLGNEEMAGQISWLLPFALIGALVWLRRPSLTWLRNLSEQEIVVIALLLWLIPELGYFSLSSGHFHLYYLVMVAPPLAALVGIGVLRMYQTYLGPGIRGWLLVMVIPVTGLVQGMILLYTPEFSGILPWVIVLGSFVIGGVLAGFRIRHHQTVAMIPGIVVLGLLLLLIAPAVWSITPLLSPADGHTPVAGPVQINGKGISGGQNPGISLGNTDYSDLIRYLQSHKGSEKYLVGMSSANGGGSDMIVRTGEAVMAIGGYSGSDPILTNETLKVIVRNGDIRYFYLSQKNDRMSGISSEGVTSWIPDSCQVVQENDWSANSTSQTRSGQRSVLYDCLGA